MNQNRSLYLVAYDVCNPSRLRKVRQILTDYKVGGQKSVFEAWLTPPELRLIHLEIKHLMDPEQDRLNILALDPRMKPRCMGRAQSFEQRHFSIV